MRGTERMTMDDAPQYLIERPEPIPEQELADSFLENMPAEMREAFGPDAKIVKLKPQSGGDGGENQ